MEQTFKMIFTSPSSARGNLDAEEVLEPRGKQKTTLTKRPSVAMELKMNGQVTARAIAYAAVQVLLWLPSLFFLAHIFTQASLCPQRHQLLDAPLQRF